MAYSLQAMKYLWLKKISKKKWKYIVVMLAITAVFFLERKWNMKDVLTYPVEVIGILFLTNSRKVLSFMQFLLTDIILSLLQRVIVYIIIVMDCTNYLYLLNGSLEKLILNLFTIVLIFSLRGKLKKYRYYLSRLTWYHIGLALFIGLCLIFLVVQAEMGLFFNGTEIANHIVMIVLLLMCLILLVFMIFFVVVDINRKHYQEQNILKDKYLMIQEKYYKMVASKDKETRKIRHDLKAHLSCVEILLEKENYEEVKEYIKALKHDTMKRIDTVVNSGNDIINAVLLDIAETAKEHDTKIVLTGMIPPNLKIKSPELCSLFYNLLSNSEEAMRNYEGNLKREISVEISSYKRNVGIVVRNPVIQPVEIDALKEKYTTKSKKEYHGYGMENIRTIVEKYHGMLEFENVAGCFVVKIIFKDIVNI